MKAVKKYSLYALLAIGLACNANAKQGDPKDKKVKEDKGKLEKVVVVDALPGPKTTSLFQSRMPVPRLLSLMRVILCLCNPTCHQSSNAISSRSPEGIGGVAFSRCEE
jgi:hypothetical protein